MNKLVVIGTGIKSISHITQEALKILREAEKVLYLVNEPYLGKWIAKHSKKSETLESLYFSFNKRLDAYLAISEYIIQEYKKYSVLCVAFYGHPTLFVNSGLWAAKKIIRAGGEVVILPAISTLDCLFSELQFDPGDVGCYFLDATDFLLRKKKFDVRSHLILFQVGILSSEGYELSSKIYLLKKYLLKHYPEDHQICLYESSQYPAIRSRIEFMSLNCLSDANISSLTSLYIPPLIKV